MALRVPTKEDLHEMASANYFELTPKRRMLFSP